MPVYEEKLICPFAIRFTQEHIRTTFRDGRDVEATTRQIVPESADGSSYDVILRAPFPHIEITRWHDSPVSEDVHWFTFDNRRLYSLQRAAAQYWPKRVAAVVEVLYSADRTSWKRKFDTMTSGQRVSVRHSSLQNSIGTWHWHRAVEQRSTGTVMVAHLCALRAVEVDDAKTSVDALLDAPEEKVTKKALVFDAMPYVQNCITGVSKVASEDRASDSDATPSTGLSDDEAPQKPSVAAPPEQSILATLTKNLKGTWKGSRGETYTFHPFEEHTWTCMRNEDGSHKKFTVTYDKNSSLVWWGVDGKYFLDPSELCGWTNQIKWYNPDDLKKQRPKFKWNRVRIQSEVKCNDDCRAAGKKPVLKKASQSGMQSKSTSNLGNASRDAHSRWSTSEIRPGAPPGKWVVKANP